jgi:hypothetical protein
LPSKIWRKKTTICSKVAASKNALISHEDPIREGLSVRRSRGKPIRIDDQSHQIADCVLPTSLFAHDGTSAFCKFCHRRSVKKQTTFRVRKGSD